MNEKIIVTGRVLPISKSTKERNAAFFGLNSPSKLCTEKSQCDQRSEGQNPGVETPAGGVHYCVSFIVHRPRLLDKGDNDRFALKPGRDFIAALLGLASDDCPEIEWHYHQIKSRSKSTTVIIEILWTEQKEEL